MFFIYFFVLCLAIRYVIPKQENKIRKHAGTTSKLPFSVLPHVNATNISTKIIYKIVTTFLKNSFIVKPSPELRAKSVKQIE